MLCAAQETRDVTDSINRVLLHSWLMTALFLLPLKENVINMPFLSEIHLFVFARQNFVMVKY